MLDEPDTRHNTDEEGDVEKETEFESSTFQFAAATGPNAGNSVCDTNDSFVMAMLKNTMPTLHVHGGQHANLRELKLESACPLQFPFGLGGPTEHRETRISPEEVYKHYCKLSLSQSMCGF